MHISTITLDLPLTADQIPLFRQAVLDIKGIDQELYNNKKTDQQGRETHVHRYPPIQYRVREGYATIWAINEGARRLEADIRKKKILTFFWRGRERSFHLIRHFNNTQEEAQYTSPRKYYRYRIINYLPFSNHEPQNTKPGTWQEYKAAAAMTEKIDILERIIVSHLVLFSYAAGWPLKQKQKLKARLADITAISTGYYKKGHPDKEKRFLKMDLTVEINALLPDGIALGNLTSLGYGVLYRPDTDDKD